MILVDANLLLYAVNQDAPLHEPSRSWLESTINGAEIVGLPWVVLLAFVRLTTRPGVFARPLSVGAAFGLVEAWLEQPNVISVEPTPRHVHILRGLLERLGTGGNLTSDAHLAALAIEYGAVLCSADPDFSRFPGLQWRNPLERT